MIFTFMHGWHRKTQRVCWYLNIGGVYSHDNFPFWWGWSPPLKLPVLYGIAPSEYPMRSLGLSWTCRALLWHNIIPNLCIGSCHVSLQFFWYHVGVVLLDPWPPVHILHICSQVISTLTMDKNGIFSTVVMIDSVPYGQKFHLCKEDDLYEIWVALYFGG